MNISKEDLIKKFDGTSLEPKPVIIVVHFKEVLNLLQKDMLPLSHFCYVILDVASSCDDPNLKYVIYQNLETGRIWAREINDFFEDHDVLFPFIGQTKHMCIWPQLESDIHRHFKHMVSNTINEEACDSKLPSQSKPDSLNDSLRKCSPEKDPCVPPKWLTQHLYVDSVENDGELPDKKKLHDLLDYMVDYVGSWTGCDDAYSAQQMKDMLPLLVRCKNILKKKNSK